MQLPTDRGHVQTEQRNRGSMELDALDSRECVELMIEDHKLVSDALLAVSESLASLIDSLSERFNKGGRIIYIGAGTSGRLGVLDASECPPTFQSDPDRIIGLIAGGDAALRKSSESAEDDASGSMPELTKLKLTTNDTLIGLAAGGTTPYVLGAIKIAKSMGAHTALITCAQPKNKPDNCDHLIVLETGPELLTGSTRLKAGTATKLALNIITTTLFVQLGKVYSNLMVDLRATNAKLTDRAIRILIELCPDLCRQSAQAVLQKANGNLKIAIVMRQLNVTMPQAQDLLNEHNGVLRSIIEP
ncbi:MAG: N-acetylmuramic acid 6-phosphate etherase [Planctomycetes bacterium]|nr:N-acetylmuramic acid 6-phosphate etherase [Planctomycetota bacterium]